MNCSVRLQAASADLDSDATKQASQLLRICLSVRTLVPPDRFLIDSLVATCGWGVQLGAGPARSALAAAARERRRRRHADTASNLLKQDMAGCAWCWTRLPRAGCSSRWPDGLTAAAAAFFAANDGAVLVS